MTNMANNPSNISGGVVKSAAAGTGNTTTTPGSNPQATIAELRKEVSALKEDRLDLVAQVEELEEKLDSQTKLDPTYEAIIKMIGQAVERGNASTESDPAVATVHFAHAAGIAIGYLAATPEETE